MQTMTRTDQIQLARIRRLVQVAGVLGLLAVCVNLYYWRAAPRRRAAAAVISAVSQPDPRRAQVDLLRRQLAVDPNNRKLRIQLAEAYMGMRDFGASLTQIAVLRAAEPENPEYLFREAVVRKFAGDPHRAEQLTRQVLARLPQHAPAREWLAETLLDQHRSREAEQAFADCVKRHPNSVFALLGLARAREQRLQDKQAINIADVIGPTEKVVQLAPQNAEALAALARMKFTYLRQGDEAEKLALRAAELAPNQIQSWLVLSEVYLARPPTPENLQKAAEYTYRAGVSNLGDPRPPYYVGRLSLAQNDPARAVQAFEHSLRLGAMPEAVAQLAAAYGRLGKPADAERFAAIHRQYTDRLERRNAVLSELRRTPTAPELLCRMAEVYLEAGQPENAAIWIAEVRRLRPSDPRPAKLLARADALRKDPKSVPLLAIP